MIRDLKICGISDPKTLNYILNHPHPPKFIGFITNYKKSRRYVEFENLKNLVNVNKKQTKMNIVQQENSLAHFTNGKVGWCNAFPGQCATRLLHLYAPFRLHSASSTIVHPTRDASQERHILVPHRFYIFIRPRGASQIVRAVHCTSRRPQGFFSIWRV